MRARANRARVFAQELKAPERIERARVTRRLAVLACCAAATWTAGTAGAGVSVGVNEDATLEAASPSWFFATMQSEGLTVDSVTLRWDESLPASIGFGPQTAVAAAVAAASAAGVTVQLDLYPLHAQVFTGGKRCKASVDPTACGNGARIRQFASWTALVARTFPTVHQFVVMNECNQPLFLNPQWDTAGRNASAEICGRALAAAYDSLHAVDKSNVVWGLGLSPRGNDNASAATNSSTSPVAFLRDLGAWFKAFNAQSGRTAPLMDGLDFHPYPIPQSEPFLVGYADTSNATVSNLPRIYQAFYDGFRGSPQRTIGQQRGGGLPVSLNEVGVQTDESREPGYSGTETSGTPAGGVVGRYATQAYQAGWYQQMLDLVSCDPNVRVVNLFHLVDEPSLAGWQSGLFEASPGTPVAKRSAQVVRNWVAATGGSCRGLETSWTPGSAAPPRLLARRFVRAMSGGVLSSPDGAVLRIAPGVLAGDAWASISSVSRQLYDVRVGAALRGSVALTLPAAAGVRDDVIVGRTSNGWQIESGLPGQLTVGVRRLSTFTTIGRLEGPKAWAGCVAQLTAPVGGRAGSVADQGVACLLRLGVGRVSASFANRFLSGRLDLKPCPERRYLDLAALTCVADDAPAVLPNPAAPTPGQPAPPSTQKPPPTLPPAPAVPTAPAAPPAPAPSVPPGSAAFPETARPGDAVQTLADIHDPSSVGTPVEPGATVGVACKLQDADTGAYWYRLAGAPWSGGALAPATAFLNGDPPDGPAMSAVDPTIPDCESAPTPVAGGG